MGHCRKEKIRHQIIKKVSENVFHRLQEVAGNAYRIWVFFLIKLTNSQQIANNTPHFVLFLSFLCLAQKLWDPWPLNPTTSNLWLYIVTLFSWFTIPVQYSIYIQVHGLLIQENRNKFITSGQITYKQSIGWK